MKKSIIYVGCLVTILWTILAQAGHIPSNKMILFDDLLLTKKQHDVLAGTDTIEDGEYSFNKWEKNSDGLVVIPFAFDPNAGFAENETEFLVNELKKVEAGTCIRFEPRRDESDYVEIENGFGCSSSLGKKGGRQQISINRTVCIDKGVLTHEAIHTLGFEHMQKAYDRDDFVTVQYENIIPEQFSQFDKVDSKSFKYFGTTYDLRSIMHYRRNAFSKNKKDTIIPHDLTYIDVIGQIPEISEGDLLRINAMYECN